MKPQNVNRRTSLVKLSCVLFTAIAFLITSCKKDDLVTPASPTEAVATGSAAAST